MKTTTCTEHSDGNQHSSQPNPNEANKVQTDRHADFFGDRVAAAAFDSAFLSKLAALQREVTSSFLSPENTQRFVHGEHLRHPAAKNFFDGGMHTYSTELTAKYQDLRENNVSAFAQAIQIVGVSMHKQFAQMFYSTIQASCDQIGNVVDAHAEGSLLAALEAMWEKLEISVDPQGIPKMPEMHLGPEAFEKMKAAISEVPKEVDDRIEAIKARKIAEARAREKERQAKFVKYGGPE